MKKHKSINADHLGHWSKWSILSVTMAILVIAPLASASCLTSEQQLLLTELANKNNLSSSVLISIFEQLCDKDDQLESNFDNYYEKTEALQNFYTKADIDSRFSDYSTWDSTKDYIDLKLESVANYSSVVDQKLEAFNQTLESKLNQTTSRVDSKLANFTKSIEEQLNLSRTIQLIANILNSSTETSKAEILAILDAKAEIIKHDIMVEITTIRDNYLSKAEYYEDKRKQKPASTIVRNVTLPVTTQPATPQPEGWRPDIGVVIALALAGLVIYEVYRRVGKGAIQFGRKEGRKSDLGDIKNEIIKGVISEYEKRKSGRIEPKRAGRNSGAGNKQA
jgi:hypothetical protein